MYSFRRCLWVRGFFVSHFSRNLWNAIWHDYIFPVEILKMVIWMWP
jgi:hypothetical protein